MDKTQWDNSLMIKSPFRYMKQKSSYFFREPWVYEIVENDRNLST